MVIIKGIEIIHKQKYLFKCSNRSSWIYKYDWIILRSNIQYKILIQQTTNFSHTTFSKMNTEVVSIQIRQRK